MKIITAGDQFWDIDALACAYAYCELLKLKGVKNKIYLKGFLNISVPNRFRKINYNDKVSENELKDSDVILVDISDYNYVTKGININNVVKIFDYHFGFEEYWKKKIGEENVNIEKVGAAATLIWEEFKKEKLENKISKLSINLLYTAIISNSLNLQSSVSGSRDEKALNELKILSNLPSNWAEVYWEEVSKKITKNLKEELKKDTKKQKLGNLDTRIAQLELWDAKTFVVKYKQQILNHLGSYNVKISFMNIPSIKEGISYIIALNNETENFIASVFRNNFKNGILKTANLIQRKEILRRLQKNMDDSDIKKILKGKGFCEPNKIVKIEIGFSNDVFDIDNKYILKVVRDKNDNKGLEKEIYLYDLFAEKIPVPQVLFSGKKGDRTFYLMKKLSGENLYSKWHCLTSKQRKNIIKQLTDYLKIINNESYKDFAKKFKVNTKQTWKENFTKRFEKRLEKVKKKNILLRKEMVAIKQFFDFNINFLDQSKLTLTHWDVHFDNLLINNDGVISGFLDFERIEIMSFEYVLAFVRLIQTVPTKFASEKSERLVKKEDYKKLMNWYQEFYPELFDFKALEKRLDLYLIFYELGNLMWFSDSVETRKRIFTAIKKNL